jgi:hypothetical protein
MVRFPIQDIGELGGFERFEFIQTFEVFLVVTIARTFGATKPELVEFAVSFRLDYEESGLTNCGS